MTIFILFLLFSQKKDCFHNLTILLELDIIRNRTMDRYESYLKKLFLISSRIDKVYHKQASAFGISASESFLFYFLGEKIANTQTEIIKIWGISKTTLNSAVMKAYKNGFIEFGKKIGKEKTLILTEKGKKFADIINGQTHRAELKALIDTEQKLRKIGVNIEDLTTIFENYADVLSSELDKELIDNE